jgi:S1-C subfamily serine protease
MSVWPGGAANYIVLAQANPPDWIEYQGISVLGERRGAVLSGVTVSVGESALLKTLAGETRIKCLSIDERSVEVMVEGETEPRTVELSERNRPTRPFKPALALRSTLERLLTKVQISHGQRLASAFVEGKERDPDRNDRPPIPENVEWKTYGGSGFFVTDDGYVVTWEHVVRGATSFRVKSRSGSHAARLVKRDRSIDVALLKVEGAFNALPVAPEPSVKLGDAVFTVGFPNPVVQGEKPKLTRGEISSMAGIRDNPRYFQISVPVQPGNSGGALVDESGNVVGVVTARLNDIATYEFSGALPQNVNYAVKGNAVRDFLNSVPEVSGKLKAPGKVKDREVATVAAERSAVLVIAE